MITQDFTAYAFSAEVRNHHKIQSEELTTRIELLLSDIAKKCTSEGAYLIGHIKCIVEEENGSFITMSVTDIEHPPMVKGRLADLVEYDIVINILLYGMTKDAIVANIEPMILSTLSSDGSIINVSSHDEHDLHHAHHHQH